MMKEMWGSRLEKEQDMFLGKGTANLHVYLNNCKVFFLDGLIEL